MALKNRYIVVMGDRRIDLSDFSCVEPGASITGSFSDVLEHIPDNAISEPVRAIPNAKTYTLTLNGTTGQELDQTIKSLAPLKRLLNDSDSRALRASAFKDSPICYLRTQLKGASEWTQWGVKFGVVNDAQSFTMTQSDKSGMGWRIVVNLVCYPRGELKQFTMRNDLPSSPHMVEDSDGDGLADGLTFIGSGTATPSISESVYLIGGKSQQVVTDNSSVQGYASSTISCTSGDDVHASLYVFIPTGDYIVVDLQSGTATIDRVELSPNPTKNYIEDKFGNKWQRVELAGTTTTTNVRVRVFRESATEVTVFYFDALYLSLNPFPSNSQPNPVFNELDAIDPTLPEGIFVATGSPTTTMSITDKLFGYRAVSVLAGATSDAISTEFVFSISDHISAYTWVLVSSGSVSIDVRGSNVYETKVLDSTDSNGIASDSITNSVGTWYKVEFEKVFTQFGGLGTLAMQFTCDSDTTAFKVDNIYLDKTGAWVDELPRWPLQLPRGWVSSSYVKNRYDPDSGGEDCTNYLDTWGIVGDMNPAIDVRLTPDDTDETTAYDRLYAYRNIDRRYLAETFQHWLEVVSPNFTGTGWANVTDSTRAGGKYFRYTDSGSGGETADTPTASGLSDIKSLLSLPFQVFIICRSTSTATTLTFEMNMPSTGNIISGEAVSVNTANQWELLEIGLGEGVGLYPIEDSVGITTVPDLTLTTANAPNASTFDIDGILFMPSYQALTADFSADIQNAGTANNVVLISGVNEYVASRNNGIQKGVLSDFWSGVAGRFMMRHVFAVADSGTGEYDIDHANIVTLDIIPKVSSWGGGDYVE